MSIKIAGKLSGSIKLFKAKIASFASIKINESLLTERYQAFDIIDF